MKSNKYLTIGLLTGFIVGGCIGVETAPNSVEIENDSSK